MNIKHMLVSIGVSLVLLVGLTPVAYAADGDVSGSFTAADVVSDVTVVEIYSDLALTSVVNSLTPQVEYYVKVTAGDANTIDDIDEIEVQLFYDAGGTDPAAPGVSDNQTCAILTWTKAGDTWVISPSTGTSWALNTGNSTRPSAMTDSSDDWVFAVTPGKVATESPGSDNWDLYAKATDGGGNDTIYNRTKEILWYGEISTAATAPFGSVTPGTGFGDNVNEVGSTSVTYTSNGDYDQKVKSDASWTGGSLTATYDATGACTNVQEFSLNAYDSDVFGSAVQVDTTGVSIDATGTITGETGNTVSTNTLWLKVASTFGTDTYNGNITYIIADR